MLVPIYDIAKELNWIEPNGLKLTHHEARALTWEPEVVGEAFTRSPQDQKSSGGLKLPGVRVDKIFVLSASINNDAPNTRAHRRMVNVLDPPVDNNAKQKPNHFKIDSVNTYLNRGTVWDGAIVQDAIQRKRQVGILKGMLPVEFKV